MKGNSTLSGRRKGGEGMVRTGSGSYLKGGGDGRMENDLIGDGDRLQREDRTRKKETFRW
jgi:hypothetical protein